MIKLAECMRNLFVANNDTNLTVKQHHENLKELQLAMNYLYFDMKIQLAEEEIKKLEQKIANKPDSNGKCKYTPEQVEGFKSEKAILETNLASFEKQHKSCKDTYEKVLNTVSERDKSAFKRFLRLQGAMYDSKCWGLVLELDCFEDVETLYTCMETIHNPADSKLIGENGFVKGKTITDTIKQANDCLAKELRQLFSIFDENPYVEKMALKFNKTALHNIHETYVTGMGSGTKVDKDGNLTNKSVSLKTSIVKGKNKDTEETVYNCGKFGKNLTMVIKDIIVAKAEKMNK